MLKKMILALSVLVMMASCNLPGIARPTSGLVLTTIPQPTAEDEAEPTPDDEGSADPGVPEAIMIQMPGPGSRLISPIRIAGIADPTHEQTLIVRGFRPDGSEIIPPQPINIAAPLGERGPFEVEIPFTVNVDEQVFLQVYAQSARDGGITHLASVGVVLSASGPENIIYMDGHEEQISIQAPTEGQTVSGGSVHIEGIGIASFEGTFVLEVLDENGNVVGSQPVIAAAPDMGLPGTFNADVIFMVSSPGPGRVVVRDPSPAFGGDVHLASVEVQLEP